LEVVEETMHVADAVEVQVHEVMVECEDVVIAM
jgi:hypothetical protein